MIYEYNHSFKPWPLDGSSPLWPSLPWTEQSWTLILHRGKWTMIETFLFKFRDLEHNKEQAKQTPGKQCSKWKEDLMPGPWDEIDVAHLRNQKKPTMAETQRLEGERVNLVGSRHRIMKDINSVRWLVFMCNGDLLRI